MAEEPGASRAEPAPDARRHLAEDLVHLGEPERRLGRGCHLTRFDDRCTANTNAPLARRSAQKRDGDFSLIGLSLGEEFGEARRLLQPAGRVGHGAGRIDEIGKAHEPNLYSRPRSGAGPFQARHIALTNVSGAYARLNARRRRTRKPAASVRLATRVWQRVDASRRGDLHRRQAAVSYTRA